MTTLTRDDVLARIKALAPGGRLNLRRADLSGTDLSGANLRGADLSDADLSGANLRGANLSWASLRRADLSDADLSRANLRHADLRWANLRRANLRRADLRWADLSDADLRWARTEYPILSIPDTPSGPTVLIHTGGAWRLDIGCWQERTVRELRDLIATDDGWPDATGEECARRRPILAAVADLCDAHIAYHCTTDE